MSNLLQLSKHFLKANLSVCLKTNRQTVSSRTRPIVSTNPLRASGVINVQGKGHSILSPIFIRRFHTSGGKCADKPSLFWRVIAYGKETNAALTGRFKQWRVWQPENVQQMYYIGYVLLGWVSITILITPRAFSAVLIVGAFTTVSAVSIVLALKAASIVPALKSVSATVISVFTMYYCAHILKAPITGRKRFISMTTEQYINAANHQSEKFVKDNSVTNKHPVYATVDKVVCDITAANEDFPKMKDRPWKIFVIDSEDKNIFVLPNGHIFVYTGLLECMDNKDQLAVVLGHEMAHALLFHAAEQLSRDQFLRFLIVGIFFAICYFLPTDWISKTVQIDWITTRFYEMVEELLGRNYSKKIEKEADEVGLYLAAKACFDIREGPVFWEKMSTLGIDGKEVADFQFKHGYSAAKTVETLNELMPKAIETREKCPRCLNQKLPEEDPKNRSPITGNANSNSLIAQAAKANPTLIEENTEGNKKASKTNDKEGEKVALKPDDKEENKIATKPDDKEENKIAPKPNDKF